MSIDQWSTTAANNATGVTGINWAEGQAPSTVNDSARQLMADVAAWYANTVAGFTTGDVKLTIKTVADTGWVLMNDGTIGSAASAATTRANADTSSLYTLLWNNTANADCAVSTGRGANAAADFAANKTIALPKALGRAMACYGTGSGLTARTMGAIVGVESVTLSAAESGSVAHSHTSSSVVHHTTADGTAGSTRLFAAASSNTTSATSNTDSTDTCVTTTTSANSAAAASSAHTNMGPQVFLNVMIKL